MAKRILSTFYEKLGNLSIEEGDLPAARSRYEKLLALAQELADVDPQNSEAQRDLFVAHGKLGHVAFTQHDYRRATEHFDAVITVFTSMRNRGQFVADAEISETEASLDEARQAQRAVDDPQFVDSPSGEQKPLLLALASLWTGLLGAGRRKRQGCRCAGETRTTHGRQYLQRGLRLTAYASRPLLAARRNSPPEEAMLQQSFVLRAFELLTELLKIRADESTGARARRRLGAAANPNRVQALLDKYLPETK